MRYIIRCKIASLPSIIVILACMGCGFNEKGADQVVDEMDELYDLYLSSDIDHAKKAILSSLEVLLNSPAMSENGLALSLSLSYARLAFIERIRGDLDASFIAYVRSKYWYQESLLARGIPERFVVAHVKEYDYETMEFVVAKYDHANTDGRGPHFKELDGNDAESE